MSEPQIGDIYQDKDKRMTGRYVRVILLDDNEKRALCVACTTVGQAIAGKSSKISYGNLNRRFRLIANSTFKN